MNAFRIGLFGGSFDPVHCGHLLVAQAAGEELGLRRLFFVLAARSPFKPDMFATACCGIELMQAGGPRYDIDRLGMIPRATPRQADLMIVAGTITHKMAGRVRVLWEQMTEPRWVVSMGSCANSGGPFSKWSYSVLNGIDKYVPVDVYIPGCPPRPEALIDGVMALRERVRIYRTFGHRATTPHIVAGADAPFGSHSEKDKPPEQAT